MPAVIAFIDDLVFESKVRASAEALGVPLVVARSPAAAEAELAKGGATVLVVDLEAMSGDPLRVIRAARALPAPPRVHAYGSHVQVDLARAAQEAGADDVMPRSRFVTQLAAILSAAR
jgi:DNA-binding NarL/FixJ family response regulator